MKLPVQFVSKQFGGGWNTLKAKQIDTIDE